MAGPERSWSCSTLMAGMKHVSKQPELLKGKSDEELAAELEVANHQLGQFVFYIFY